MPNFLDQMGDHQGHGTQRSLTSAPMKALQLGLLKSSKQTTKAMPKIWLGIMVFRRHLLLEELDQLTIQVPVLGIECIYFC
jgi:hypothetical protein